MKTKAQISFAVTAKLICAFVFAYADCWFSCVVAQVLMLKRNCSICLAHHIHEHLVMKKCLWPFFFFHDPYLKVSKF